MKIRLLIAFLFISLSVLSAQNEPEIPSKCEETHEKAAADFKRGVRKIYIFGIVSQDKYRLVLKEKYNIDAVYMGCLVTQEAKCYTEYMEKAIGEERGFGFWEKVKMEANTKVKISSPF